MCGVLGIFGYDDIAPELVQGLTALQHRGQDAAGVVTFDRTFHMKKGLGLVGGVFDNGSLGPLSGSAGLGHVRYATIGSTELLDAQPIAVNYPFGVAMVHNGNVVNYAELRRTLYEDHHRLLDTSNDVALILYTFASQLERKNLKALTVDDIFDTVEATQARVEGAYSAVAIIANRGFLAFSDPHGIRPLVLGRRFTDRGMVYAFASETTCFDYLGYEWVRDLEPGEAVFIDQDRRIHSRICRGDRQAFCVFEYIYFAREDSIIHHRPVAGERLRLGQRLARTVAEAGLHPDIVIDVPASAYFFASGMAEALGVPYRRGLAKNAHVGRSFISPTQEQRELLVRQKLNPIREIVRGRKVAVVDDSIVRGTTSKHLVRLLRQAGAEEVYFVSASPPIKYPCIYGIDMSIRREIIASHYGVEDIARYIGADAVVYQRLEDLRELYGDLPICDACFSGRYPTGVSQQTLCQIEEERECSKRR
jgi:amidophosphoribosyltransferase